MVPISVIVETRRGSKVLKRIAETVTALDRTLGRAIGTGTAPDRTLHPSLTESIQAKVKVVSGLCESVDGIDSLHHCCSVLLTLNLCTMSSDTPQALDA